MQRPFLKAFSIAAASSLLLTGCYAEYLNPDGNCAEITTGQYPPMLFDTGETPDIYFEVETDGSYEEMYAYIATPTDPEFLEILPENDPLRDFLEGIQGDTVSVDRWSTSYDVSDSNPHTVSLGADEVGMLLAMYGMAVPIGVLSVCDDAAYRASLPTASPTVGPEGSVEVDLPNSAAKVFYPGYDPDAIEVALPGDNVLNVDVEASDLVYMKAMVLPWIGEFGDMSDASFAELWYAAYNGVASSYILNNTNSVSVTKEIDVQSSESFTLDPEFVSYEYFNDWVTDGPMYADMDDRELLGAIVVTIAASAIDNDTLRVRFSYEVAQFGADGTFGAVDAAPVGIDYDGPQYLDSQLKGKPGEQVTLTGSNMLVNSVRIGGQNARIIANTATSLTLEIPASLAGGKYDVHYTFAGGEVNRQLGGQVIDHSVWTKRLSSTQAKLYAKNVAGAGKVQFMLNGTEVAWVDAADANDPKLRKANGAHYLVRTVNLKAGKNVLEIWVDGVREQRTVYTR